MNEIIIPRNTLVVLCGPAGSGKSTWAAKHFLQTQVVSSDQCRALICDDAADQSVTPQAFDLMHSIIKKRLMLGRTTVADATNLKREHRRELIRIAKIHHFNTAAVVFNLAIETCISRNAQRTRKVPQQALIDQYTLLERTLRTIDKEGFDFVYVLDEAKESSSSIRITRRASPFASTK